MRRSASEVIRNLEQRIARLERQAGRIGKKCVIKEIYRHGREGGEGEAIIVCDGVKIGVNFDTLGHSFIVGNDKHLRETGATAIFESLKKEYRKTNIKEFIATAVGIAGEKGMTLDQCVKLSEMMF